MSVLTEEKVVVVPEKTDELAGIAAATDARDIARLNYRLSDAIREGSAMSRQVRSWGDGVNTACAMTAALIGADARGISLG